MTNNPTGPAKHFVPAPHSARFVRLRPVRRDDLRFLYQLAVDELIGPRWRMRGKIPNEAVFEQRLWENMLVQLVIEATSDGRSIGTACAYAANMSAQNAYVALALQPVAVGHGLGIEALALFVRYLFITWPLRKVYLELPEFNIDIALGNAKNILHEEGRLKGHEYYNGRYWDSVIFAIYAREAMSNEQWARASRQPVDMGDQWEVD